MKILWLNCYKWPQKHTLKKVKIKHLFKHKFLLKGAALDYNRFFIISILNSSIF